MLILRGLAILRTLARRRRPDQNPVHQSLFEYLLATAVVPEMESIPNAGRGNILDRMPRGFYFAKIADQPR